MEGNNNSEHGLGDLKKIMVNVIGWWLLEAGIRCKIIKLLGIFTR